MTREEKINALKTLRLKIEPPTDTQLGWLETWIHKEDMEALNSVIQALEQEQCEDAISRQAVDEIKELMTDINGDTVYAVRMSDIRQLPPVNSQPKTGHWILIDKELSRYECSECGEIIRLYENETLEDYPFSHCGAKMEGEKTK